MAHEETKRQQMEREHEEASQRYAKRALERRQYLGKLDRESRQREMEAKARSKKGLLGNLGLLGAGLGALIPGVSPLLGAGLGYLGGGLLGGAATGQNPLGVFKGTGIALESNPMAAMGPINAIAGQYSRQNMLTRNQDLMNAMRAGGGAPAGPMGGMAPVGRGWSGYS